MLIRNYTIKLLDSKELVFNYKLATDAEPEGDNGPNSGLVDVTYIRVGKNMGKQK